MPAAPGWRFVSCSCGYYDWGEKGKYIFEELPVVGWGLVEGSVYPLVWYKHFNLATTPDEICRDFPWRVYKIVPPGKEPDFEGLKKQAEWKREEHEESLKNREGEYTELWNGKIVSCTGGHKCQDCHARYEGYMVLDEVWQAAGLGEHENVCIPCLSHRLGRELTLADFCDAPVNGPIGYLKNQKEILRRRACRFALMPAHSTEVTH